MKRTALTILISISFTDAFSQTNTFPDSGNVGIGITSPITTLQVRPPILPGGDLNRNVLLFTDLYNNGSNGQNLILTTITNKGAYAGWNFSSDWSGRLSFGVFTNSTFNTAPNEYLTIIHGGNVGIGTVSPAHKLDIVGDGINLENTTYANQHGIIFKNGTRFISDFNYGNNGTVTTAGGNIFIGIGAGNFTMGSTAMSSDQASFNTAIGYESCFSNTTGARNTAVGYKSLLSNTTGNDNTAMGFESLSYNTTGSYNTADGFYSLLYNITGNNNTANGFESLLHNTSGGNNTTSGYETLEENTTGSNNTATGYDGLAHNTTGNNNTAIGFEAMIGNITGYNNTASGYSSLCRNESGYNNAAYGYESLFYNTIGSYNTASGYFALLNNTIGNYNIATGYEAGRYIANTSNPDTGSSYSIFIGVNTKSLTPSDDNEIVLGYNATGAGSNSVVLGNTSVTKTLLQGNVLIGKTSQTNSSYKLDVNGNIRANQVTVNATGADYVFDPTFQLPSLDSLNNYIKLHHHLPGIPSAEKMQRNGINIGEAYTELLVKMEEMTRYITTLNKKIELKNEEINKLQQSNQEIVQMKQRLDKIEQLLKK